jgi:UDP-glucose 4-epimerase
LVRVLGDEGHDVVGLDVLDSPYTHVLGSVADRSCVRTSVEGANAVLHTATLHKPHIGSHGRQAFIDTNVTGTLTLLEEAVAAGVSCFVFTSTTSAFGRALTPAADAPAAWITEDVVSVPRNVYGVTKSAAEDLCELVSREHGLPCVVLRTSRFFPEGDDLDEIRATYDDANVKANELLYRRVDLDDVVSAHRRAMDRAADIGFGRYIVSATTPFGARRPRTTAYRCPCRGAPILPRLRECLCRARVADVSHYRACVCQQSGRRGAGMGPALRLPSRARQSSSR